METEMIQLTSAAEEAPIRGTEWPTNSIFRAPAIFNKHGRELCDREDFEPDQVSIGPYHHGELDGRLHKELKLEYMFDLMKKQGVGASDNIDDVHLQKKKKEKKKKKKKKKKKDIDDVPVEPFMKWESRARSFYANEFPHTDVDFVRMLVLDSCYIIRIILYFSEDQFQREMVSQNDLSLKYRRCNLLKLENQIPLFFIKEVYNWYFPCTDNPRYPSFETILEPFISLDMPWKINRSGLSSGAAHLLELYWRCSLPARLPFKHMQPSSAEIHCPINAPKVIGSATRLHQIAGVKFEVFNHEGLDVTFSNGIMRMPCLKIDPTQRSILLNLMAFENSQLPCMRIVNSYMKLIDVLVNSEEDMRLLEQCNVLYYTLSTQSDDPTDIYKEIGKRCLIDYNAFLFSDLYENLRKYYNSGWNRRWTSLQHDHLNSLGKVITVFAGGCLLILAVLQTYYTIYDHYHRKS